MIETTEPVQPQLIEIVSTIIDSQAVLNSVGSPLAGAAVLFVGSTRQLTKGRETIELEYECYEIMARNKMYQLAETAMKNWGLVGCSVVHRIGCVPVGESSVVIATSSAHRRGAFAAAEWIIERLKEEVPIWKRELYADGTTEWVHPVKPAERSGR